MSIFNSLGSNYNLTQAFRSLAQNSKKKYTDDLKLYLEEKYKGKVFFTYKGREALRLALRSCNSKGVTVGICGFTCYAVYEAIVNEGYKVEYLDIDKDTLHFSAEALKKAVKKNPNLKIVFIQNTLGYPCDIENISKVCRENKIILLEDLAHSIGTIYENSKEAGTVGDLVMLSFSQDKVIDNVSGGALIVRNDQFQISNFKFQISNHIQLLKDRFYPLFTYIIRKTYQLGFGIAFHSLLKRVDLLSKPMEYVGQEDIHSLSDEKYKEIFDQFVNLDQYINHRRRIAKIYAKKINPKILSNEIVNLIDYSTNIRFPIFVKNRGNLIKYFKKFGVYISDIWYDAPVAPKKYLNKSNYKKGMCPNADYISDVILNLPTHKNVSVKDAEFIANKLNLWLQSQ